ncbi:hypothetical protein G5I_14657 [Acromyrmex echinatior]|uniref:Uncharacterized protein n=1 Tax=Acromyrmex echinatior TaxID=103372 RepID=F4X8B7_ACREC|nr:hypothetical protein G5I_14657 [Acromyrmex echinatior]
MYFNIDRHSQGVLTTAREQSARAIFRVNALRAAKCSIVVFTRKKLPRLRDYIQQTAHTTHINTYTPTSKPHLSQNLNVYVTTTTIVISHRRLTYKSGSEKYKLTLQKNRLGIKASCNQIGQSRQRNGNGNGNGNVKRSSGNDGIGEKARDQTKEKGTSNAERLSRQGHDMSSHGTAY